MDTDEAWEQFRKNSARIQKTSVTEKLDALGAAINEIKADTERTAMMVPKIMGDETALDTANNMAMDQGGLAPEMPPEMGGGMEMMNEDEQMPPEGDVSADTGGEPPMDAGADATGGAEMPMGEAPADAEGAPSDDDFLSDEDVDAILNGTYDGDQPNAPEPAPEPEAEAEMAGEDLPPAGDEYPEIPATGGAGLAEAANNLFAALKEAAHEAVDAGDMNKILELSRVEQQISQTLGGVVELTEPDTTPGAVGTDETENMASDELPTDDEVGDDVITNMKEDTGEAEDETEPESEPAPESESDSEPEPEPEPEPKKKDDKDSESTKKSIASIDERIDSVIDSHIKKSDVYIPPTPTLRDMMDGRFDVRSFMKGDREGYIDAAEIFKDPEVDKPDMEGVVDGGTFLMKSDDRIATARSIFDRKLMTGRTDPESVATAGTAQEALAQTGTQNPDSVSTAEKIIEVKKSADDVASKPKMSGGETDPDSIATAGTAQEALAHKGTQDPGSVATADTPVNMDGGDDSEGSTKKIDVKIEKSSLDEFGDDSKSNTYLHEVPGAPKSKGGVNVNTMSNPTSGKSSPDMMYPEPFSHVPMPEPAPAGLTTKKPIPEMPKPPAFDPAAPSNMESVNAASNRQVERRQNRAAANAPEPEIGADNLNLPGSAPENVDFKMPPKPMNAGPTTDRGVARIGSRAPDLIPETNEADHITNLMTQYDRGANRGVPDTIRPSKKPDAHIDDATYDKISSMIKVIKMNPNISPADKREIFDSLGDIYGNITGTRIEDDEFVGGDTPGDTAPESVYEHAGTMYDEDGNPVHKSSDPLDIAPEDSAPAEVKDPAPMDKSCDDMEKSEDCADSPDITKSAPGKHIMSLQEMMGIAKSNARPSMASSMGVSLSPENPEAVMKSAHATESVKMGRGVDPRKVIENDLKQYNLYKARNKF